MNLSIFNNNLFEAGAEFFSQLGIRLNSNTSVSLGTRELLKDQYKDKGIFKAIAEAYFLGLVDDSVFDRNIPLLSKEKISLKEASEKINAEYNGLMVFAVKLNDSYSPARGDIAELTRAFNRASKNVPVVLLLKYGGLVSFAASERTKYKQAWREGEKIGKISLLKDINLKSPHAGHLKILDDLKVAPAVADFNALYKQWQKVFNVQLLNKKFYQELANWYFWALKNVEFPEDAEKNKDVRNAISVIRMITRLIFIWFIKEKGLVHDDLFNQAKLKSLLNFSDKNQSTYYKAILQNLFFATLNTEMNKDKLGSRKFRGKRQEGRDQHYMIHNVLRYEDYFTSPQDTLKKYFENIPFLNGGLFECLDKDISPTLAKGGEGGFSNKKIIRIDGFSDHPKNSLKVPDHLFFSPEQSVDLNEVYGTRNKTYKVRGLIDILDSYKFTVDENTPIEEEIALDPELLGKVFENLLASYNPETQTTARKQTGSFYTPREIVNYMVDESIIAYLSSKLIVKFPERGKDEKQLDERLRHLVAYNDYPHKFTPSEVDALIAAINTLKALDPACGSGAFPMGMLHKLVYILGKLDPDNSKWRELQRQKAIKETEEAYKIGDKEEREKRLLDISEVFENNASDYGRKLYLIENCIFGVDIQPIAVQIAKLRFFVSLIVDQRINPKKENLGVRPLPNLETKFVAANTLIGIEKPAQLLLRNPEIDKKEKELKEVRERHFTARTPQTKEKYRKADERLRAEIAELLKEDGFPRETTEKLARWNPYDQNAHADFFDMEWMFGITEGFDVVIGNPPYGANFTINEKKYIKKNYFSMEGDFESYIYFIELSFNLLSKNSILSFIVPNNFLMQIFSAKIRKLILSKTILQIIDLGFNIFEASVVPTSILLLKNNNPDNNIVKFKNQNDNLMTNSFNQIKQKEFYNLPYNQFNLLLTDQNLSIYNKLNKNSSQLGEVTEIKIGIECIEKYISNTRDTKDYKPLVRGRNFEKYSLRFELDPKYVLYKKELLHRAREERLFLEPQKIIIRQTGDSIIATIDTNKLYAWKSVFVLLSKDERLDLKYVLSLINSTTLNFLYNLIVGESGRTFAQVKGVNLVQLPIKVISREYQKPFISLVTQILAAKQKDHNAGTSALERQIDKMVYALYGLTPEEIEIVEGKKN